jgi:penicillin amidase
LKNSTLAPFIWQSGHPLSAYFLAGHEAWVQGRAVALLPGRAEHRLSLHP